MLHPRNKSTLIVVCDPFNVLMNSVCLCFVEQWSPTFLAPGTEFMEDCRGGWETGGRAQAVILASGVHSPTGRMGVEDPY